MTQRLQVPEVEGIDLDFTPASYFLVRDLGLALPSDIMGEERRRLARALAEEGESLPPELADALLADDVRKAWGAIHPKMMGGEYLPPMAGDEVEIVRISLASVTFDQISVRARRRGVAIAYSIVDEYGTGGDYDLGSSTSKEPLSMRELVARLDGACVYGGAVMTHVRCNIEEHGHGVDDLRRFVRVHSDFYPDLGRYYEARLDRYFAERAAEGPDQA